MTATGPDRREADGPDAAAVVAVLAPVLAGVAAVIFLVTGFALRLIPQEPRMADHLVAAGWFFSATTVAAVAMAFGFLFVTAYRASRAHRAPEPGRHSLGLASLIAGRGRPHLREEWAAVLAGEDGETPSALGLCPLRRIRPARSRAAGRSGRGVRCGGPGRGRG
ncbi:hypothetical protein GCM10009801_14970 [Streptomyces albiaxialis]|uniref:Uncharacterized protein n=1 Tax=Streptomyces albiaxialis TaxID=329523 RepID=A0ABP5H7T8_9ACTN